MSDELVVSVPDAGLGNRAYLVDLGDGRALAVDASRDLRALRREAERRRLRVAFAADTHLHADFLSGAVQLAADEGARVLAPRAGHRAFPHDGLVDGAEVDLGGLTLRALATPGHTDEHLSFLLLDGTRALGVFSGGALIAGSAARVDLVAPRRTEELARAQYRSVRQLAELPPDTALWPTHGGGSFCSTAAGGGHISTIGEEIAHNPLLATDEEGFVTQLLATLGSYPTYFARLSDANRQGPPVLSAPPLLAAIEPAVAARMVTAGATLVDVRPIRAFATGHPQGALSIELRPAFVSWLGWLVDPGRPVVVLRDADQDVEDLLWQSLKIGYELSGEVEGGMGAWAAAGLAVSSTPLVLPADVRDAQLLDVRQDSEFDEGHLAAAVHEELGSLPGHAPAVDEGPVVVMCGHGQRAMSAASILESRGFDQLSVLAGGPQEVAAARGEQLVTS